MALGKDGGYLNMYEMFTFVFLVGHFVIISPYGYYSENNMNAHYVRVRPFSCQ